MSKIAIIGAGASGVSLAYLLAEYKEKSGKDLSITVFDNNSEAGGCIKTTEKGGYQIENGPNGILNSKRHVREIYERAGLSDILELSSSLTKRRYMQLNNKLYLAPTGPISAVTTPLLPFYGKLRILLEPFIKAKPMDDDETVYNFAKRRLGQPAADYLVSTVIGGIFAGDAKKLSIRSAFPLLYKLDKDYGSLIKGARATVAEKNRISKNKDAKSNKFNKSGKYRNSSSGLLISTNRGLQYMFIALAKRCEEVVEFRYNTDITSINKVKGGYNISTDSDVEMFDKVVLCCNAHDAAKLVKGVDRKLYETLSTIEFAPVVIYGVGIDKRQVEHKLDGFGYLVVPSDAGIVLGTLFSSSLYPNRAPGDKALLTCILIGDRNKKYIEKSDEEIIEVAMRDVRKSLGITGEPEVEILQRNMRALPQYYVGHHKLVDTINERLNYLGDIYLSGNTMSGVSVSDCIQRSIDVSEMIIKEL